MRCRACGTVEGQPRHARGAIVHRQVCQRRGHLRVRLRATPEPSRRYVHVFMHACSCGGGSLLAVVLHARMLPTRTSWCSTLIVLPRVALVSSVVFYCGRRASSFECGRCRRGCVCAPAARQLICLVKHSEEDPQPQYYDPDGTGEHVVATPIVRGRKRGRGPRNPPVYMPGVWPTRRARATRVCRMAYVGAHEGV